MTEAPEGSPAKQGSPTHEHVPDERPVYVLGAGFSKAISQAMPVTDELGRELMSRLAGEIEFDLMPGQTFEDWLTLQVTPLPFMEGYANSRRLANAARVIAEIAAVLDERMIEATADPCPIWLRQLVSIWDAEQAVVLTFNYDTLVERAVNTNMPVSGAERGHLLLVQGDHVAFPAPPAPAPQLYADAGAQHSDLSFQLLKLHGSLDWYWAEGDTSGTTLVRVRERHTFGTNLPLAPDPDFSGTTTLDRYLIPPVSSKDGYYGSYLANSLWRSARKLLERASSMTLIGYSLPKEDRVTTQLIGQTPKGITAGVVDRETEPVSDRLGALSIDSIALGAGDTCVADYVASRITDCITSLPDSSAFSLVKERSTVLLAVTLGWDTPRAAQAYIPVWDVEHDEYRLHYVDVSPGSRSEPPHQILMRAFPAGYRTYDDLVTTTKLQQLIAGGHPFYARFPETGQRLVAISARHILIGSWDAIELKWAVA